MTGPIDFPPWIRSLGEVSAYLGALAKARDVAQVGSTDAQAACRMLELRPAVSLTFAASFTASGTVDDMTSPMGRDMRHAEQSARAKLSAFSRRVRVLKADAVSAALRVHDGSLDLLILHGTSRTLPFLLSAWLPKVRPGGYLLGDGLSRPGVAQVIATAGVGFDTGPVGLWFWRNPAPQMETSK